jgi:hypothetical protein
MNAVSMFCRLLIAVVILAANAHAAVVAPGDTYAGRTYQQWQVRWWQTAFAVPVVGGDHAIFSGGSFGGENGVVFLTGVGGPIPPVPVTLNLTIPADTALFFPIINIESSVFEPPPFHGDDAASLAANSNAILDDATDLFAVIDGIPVANLGTFRFESPPFQWGPLPANNILGAPAGTTSLAVDAGYYLLITPLSTGKHVIHFGGQIPSFGFSIDTTYNITVSAPVPEPASVTLFGSAALGLLACASRRRRRNCWVNSPKPATGVAWARGRSVSAVKTVALGAA